MQKLILFFLFFASIRISFCQSAVDWQKTTDWKLYQLKSRLVFDAKEDTLQFLKSIDLSQDTIRQFLAKAEPIQAEHGPVWMGAYLATCRLPDNDLRKIAISQYGGFFWDEKERKYYELPIETRNDWLNYIFGHYKELLQSEPH